MNVTSLLYICEQLRDLFKFRMEIIILDFFSKFVVIRNCVKNRLACTKFTMMQYEQLLLLYN